MTRAVKKARAAEDGGEKKPERRAPPQTTTTTPTPTVALGRLLPALVLRRPSLSVRTPYVADVVALPEGASAAAAAAAAAAAVAPRSAANNAANDAILHAHTPAMDCAGLVTPGRRVHVAPLSASSTARRTTHSVVLAHDTRPDGDGDALICAAPAAAERLAAAALRAGAIPELGAARAVLAQQTVSSTAGGGDGGGGGNGKGAAASTPSNTSSSSRTDFVLERDDGSVALVEVKIVVCADYPSPTGRSPPLVPSVAAAAAPKSSLKKGATAVLGVYCSASASESGAAGGQPRRPPYRRTAIFPHGHAKKEVGVVSDRAIKHVHHLERTLAEGKALVGGRERRVSAAAVLFIVARSDCAAFRPCHEACPVFARVLGRAARRGVQVLAYDVELGSGGAGAEATMALRRRLPVVLDAIGGGAAAEDDAALDATVARVLEFNATDPRTHYNKNPKEGAGAGGHKKKAPPKKKSKSKKRDDSDNSDDSDDEDTEEDEDDDDDDEPPKKKKKKATTTKGRPSRR